VHEDFALWNFLVANSVPANSISSSYSFMKCVSLVLLTLQNVISILLLRYVRTTTGPRFINSTAVFNSEIQKTIFSILFLIYEERNILTSLKIIYEKVIKNFKDTFKTGIPALLYTLQNNLLFISISNLDAATFQVRIKQSIDIIEILEIFSRSLFN
jgi:UDP-sugar transporter A1/2/3